MQPNDSYPHPPELTSPHSGPAKQRLFDRWAPSYDWLLPSVFYQALHLRLLDYIELPSTPQVLDLGCGTGRLLNRLAAHWDQLQGTGLDFSAEMVRQAHRSNRHRPRLIFLQGNAEQMPFANQQFDAVFNTISFLHYPQPERVLAEVQRVLRPEGRYYLVDFVAGGRSLLGCSPSRHLPLSPGGIRFYSRTEREQMGQQAGLQCLGHHILLGPVVLTIFNKS